MKVSGKLFRFISIPLILVLLAPTGCSSTTFKNVDIEPPARGILAALKKEQTSAQADPSYQVTITELEGKPLRMGSIELSLGVTKNAGEPVLKYTEDMTKLMHLIVVSKDLTAFQHVHPKQIKDNEFQVQLTIPFAGPYLFLTEFRPQKEDVILHKQWIQIDGNQRSNEALLPDTSWVKSIANLDISLVSSPAVTEIKAGQMVMLLFRFTDKETGKPIKQLEPFLGTSGHCVILSQNADQFVHAHAVEAMSGGANVMFHSVFPEKGIYKLWGQFQYKGELLTVPFVVEVS
ncbi:hypothetical protein [Candidatus Pristimantibacillus sp. PTI5]|uniref:hypothetical protein n=1 Tax=Candidatus Pristimantibacillus sp. PTI5 TaxID=3400422 RepID=UPI003B01B98B